MQFTAQLVLMVLFLSSISLAQQQQIQIRRSGDNATAKSSPPKLTKEQLQRATQLLQFAETGAATLDPASQIVAYADLARTYQSRDKAKAIDLLDNALQTCRDLQPDSADQGTNRQIKSELQNRVMKDLVAIAPERLDAQVFDLPPDMRKSAAGLLISYYNARKQPDRAYDLVMRVAAEDEMPYGTASQLMKAMKDRPDQVRSLFVSSLSSYENHSDQQNFRSDDDFPEMIVAFHGQLPSQIILQAIDDVLARAKKQDESMGKLNLSMASSKGAVQFHSQYEYRLFQLEPILRGIDSGRADALLRDQQQVATQLDKYPQGTNSLRSGDSPDQGLSMMMSFGDGPADGLRQGGPSVLERQRMAQIMADASKHPQDALANAALLSPEAALGAYDAIVRENLKTDAAAARTALAKEQDLVEKLPLEKQMMSMQSIAASYVQLGDTENAKKALQKGMDIAAKLYKKDIDADDPNTAPKAYWPSTNGYRSILANAQKINSVWAQSLLGEIPDDSIRVFNQIAMADSILGTPPTYSIIMSAPKKGDGGLTMMVGSDH